MKPKSLLVLIALFFTIISYSQKSNPQWMYLARYESITALAEDSLNIWVGTTTGLIQIDKATEQQIVYNMVNSDIQINYITKLFVDHNQNLWLANREQKLIKYDGQSWMEYKYLDTIISNSYYKDIEAITEDNNGNMWFGTNNLGVLKYDGADFIHYTEYHDVTNDQDMPLTDNYAMEVDSANNIWMGIFAGIATCYNAGYWADLGNWNAWNGIPAGDISVLKNDNSGMLWAASKATGVVLPGIGGGEISYHDDLGWHFIPDPNHDISEVNDLTFDNQGNLYAATSGTGVLKYDGSQFSRLTYSNPIIKSHFTTSVLFDSQGSLWIGTDKGLYKKSGTSVSRVVMPSATIQSNNLSGVFHKNDGTVYLQYTYNVIGQFYSTRSKIFKVSGNDTIEFSNPYQKVINFKYEDSLGNIWGNVAWSYPIVKLQDTIIQSISVDTSLYPNTGQIYDISWDKTKNIFWLGTQNGLFTFNPQNDAFQKIGNFMNGPYAGQILSVFADSTGCVWVGSVLSGLAKYQNNQWISQNYSWTMFNKTITDIIEDRNHNLWFVDAYSSTIGRFTGNVWNVYNTDNAPLNYQAITAVAFDKNNKLYLCQQNSDVRTLDGVHWDSAITINSNLDSYVKNIFIDENDNVFFTGNGITIYNPNGIVLSNHQYDIAKSNNEPIEIFPNPTSGNINIKLGNTHSQFVISVYDIQGKRLITNNIDNFSDNVFKLDATNLPNGVYVFTLDSKNGREFGKFVVHR